jgi:hypothetical protein
MHPCAHSSKKTTQTNQRGKEALLREDALVVMRKGTRLKLASTDQGCPQGNPVAPGWPNQWHRFHLKNPYEAQQRIFEGSSKI